MSAWTLDDLARLIDHTNLHPDATEADMKRLCDEAKHYHFKMVAINQVQSRYCAEQLAGTDIDTGAAIAFPLGQTSIAAKVFETRNALDEGANEIDYVVNLTQVRQHNWDYVADEMRQIVAVCNEAGVRMLYGEEGTVRVRQGSLKEKITFRREEPVPEEAKVAGLDLNGLHREP